MISSVLHRMLFPPLKELVSPFPFFVFSVVVGVKVETMSSRWKMERKPKASVVKKIRPGLGSLGEDDAAL